MKPAGLVVIDGVRTTFCKVGTELARLGADDLGRIAVNALLTRTGLDAALIDEVIFGCCEAFTQAYEKMAAGRGSIFVVGGTESMSQAPLLWPQSASEKLRKLTRAKSLGQKVRALASFRPSDAHPRSGLQLGRPILCAG